MHAYDHVDETQLDFAAKGHSHLDHTISTTALKVALLDDDRFTRLEHWLRSLLWQSLELAHPDAGAEAGDKGSRARSDIHRVKGWLPFADGQLKLLQGVREVFEFVDGRSDSNKGPQEGGKIILIGRNIDQQALQASLDAEMAR